MQKCPCSVLMLMMITMTWTWLRWLDDGSRASLPLKLSEEVGLVTENPLGRVSGVFQGWHGTRGFPVKCVFEARDWAEMRWEAKIRDERTSWTELGHVLAIAWTFNLQLRLFFPPLFFSVDLIYYANVSASKTTCCSRMPFSHIIII